MRVLAEMHESLLKLAATLGLSLAGMVARLVAEAGSGLPLRRRRYT